MIGYQHLWGWGMAAESGSNPLGAPGKPSVLMPHDRLGYFAIELTVGGERGILTALTNKGKFGMAASHPTKRPTSAQSKGSNRHRARSVPIRPLPALTRHDVERFWEKIDPREGPEACWPWIAALCANGYGRFKLERRLYGAHRIALYLSEPDKADLNRSLYALHSCDNPSCCNPAHLAWGTPLLNAQQASERGRLVRAPKCPLVAPVSGSAAKTKTKKALLPLDVRCQACRATEGSACMNSSRTCISPHIERWNAVGIVHPSLEDRRRNHLDLKRRRHAA